MRIDYGFNNRGRPNSKLPDISFYSGEYMAVVNCNDFDLLITEEVDLDGHGNGRIDVREVVQDYYTDGSYVTYANMEINRVCKKVEELLNMPEIKTRIAKGEDLIAILKEAGMPIRVSKVHFINEKSKTETENVTSISRETFNSLKSINKSEKHSMSEMALEIKKLEAIVAQLTRVSALEKQLGSTSAITANRRRT